MYVKKLLLSKFYTPNLLFYFSILGNIVYLFSLLFIVNICFKYCNKNSSCYLIEITAFTFNYYFWFCILLLILILGTLIELLFRKLKVIKAILPVNTNLLKKIIYIFSFILIPISFAYLIFIFSVIYTMFYIDY